MSREDIKVVLCKDGRYRCYTVKNKCIASDPIKALAKEKARSWLNIWTDRGYRFVDA